MNCFCMKRFKLLCVSLIATVVLTGCSTLRFLEGVSRESPEAVVGDPLIFDGRRLLQEFSERRLQIDTAIGSATIDEVDTVGRVFQSRNAGINFSVTGTRDPGEIELITSNRSAQLNQNSNATEVQNIYLNGLRDEQTMRSELNAVTLENALTKQSLLKESADNYFILTEYYKQQLAEESNDEKRGEIIAKLEGLQKDIDKATVESSTTTAPTLPTFPTAITGTAAPTIEGGPPTKEALDGLLAGQLAQNEQFKSLFGENTNIPSTRRQKFQQYQSYLDELYNYRNRYILDDAHRSPGRRMVRLVFPIYVPPSRSANPSEIEFIITTAESSSKNGANKKRVALQHRSVLIDALNYLAGDRDDQALPLRFDERVLVSSRMWKEYKAHIKSRSECSTPVEEEIKSLLSDKPFADSSFLRSEFPIDRDMDSLLSYLEFPNFDSPGTPKRLDNAIDALRELIAIEESEINQRTFKYLLSLRERYEEYIFRVWDYLNAAQKVGFKEVAKQCLELDLEKGWKPADDGKPQALDDGPLFSVYAMNPLIEREKVDQSVSRILSLGAFAGSNFGSGSGIGTASIGAGLRNQLLAQSADVTPIIAAKQYQNSKKDELRFGWTVYPRYTLRDGKTLSRQHTGTSFYGSVDVSLPMHIERLNVEIKDESGARVNLGGESIRLPSMTYAELFANVTSFPTVTNNYEFGIVNANEQFSFIVDGFNLWKNPTVFIGGRPHDSIQFASGNENFLRAKFDNLKGVSCDYLRKNYDRQESSIYQGRAINPDERCAARIWIHTAAGKDYVGSLVIEKTKDQKPKTVGSQAEITQAVLVKAENKLKLTWNDTLQVPYYETLKEKETKLTAQDDPGSGSKTTIDLVVTDKDKNDKNVVVEAEGAFKTNFCIKLDGTGTDPRCRITVRLGDNIILFDVVRIDTDGK